MCRGNRQKLHQINNSSPDNIPNNCGFKYLSPIARQRTLLNSAPTMPEPVDNNSETLRNENEVPAAVMKSLLHAL